MTAPEERIGAAVSAYLRSMEWTVYAEVQVPAAGKRRADIVAVRDGEVWVVECKTRLTWSAIAQAEAWEGWAHYRSVATAHGPTPRMGGTPERALFALGITWYWLSDGEVHGGGYHVPQVAPRAGLLLDALRPEHAASRPGNADGAFWTPGDEDRAQLARVVRSDPDCDLVAALRVVLQRTPKAAERAAWTRAVRSGVVPGLKARREGRRVVLSVDPADPKGEAW